MNLFSLLGILAAPQALPTPRRTWLHSLGRAGALALTASLPLALPQPAAAAPTATSLDALLLLLRLERTQYALYSQALATTGFVPANQLVDIQLLRQQQEQHLAFLTQLLNTSGVVPPALPTFDFSGQHSSAANPVLFPDVFTNYDSFLLLAQQLEEAGVGIYKTQALQLTADRTVLAPVLRTHAVEARHAAHVRTLRRSRGTQVKSWPSATDATVTTPPALAAAAAAEKNETQYYATRGAIPLTGLLVGDNQLANATALAEAFDEPLDNGVAQALLDLFV